MVKVITYGTYDLLHHGHVRLLERAKALGDYLIVGVTADDFDKTRGKINVKQTLIERIEAVRATGLADEIIVEEYEGQKIDDIKRLGVDIFTVGSDWVGKFDYLNEYCKVVYLDRTKGISSTELRSKERTIKLGLVGETKDTLKFFKESRYVNGLDVTYMCTHNDKLIDALKNEEILVTDSFDNLLDNVDAVYIHSEVKEHYEQIKKSLSKGIHVLCESPVSFSKESCKELFGLANKNKCILMESIKTAYSTAFNRLVLLVKSGRIGEVVSVESTCTSLADLMAGGDIRKKRSSICAWGPVALLPVFEVLGTEYESIRIVSKMSDERDDFDLFSKIEFIYDKAMATSTVGKGVKSEGDLVISGTKGYVYVPAPWWKTDYFEIRYEDQNENKRYYYQLDGEGIRYELVSFLKAIQSEYSASNIDEKVSLAICEVMEAFYSDKKILI